MNGSVASRAAQSVNETRLLDRHAQLASIGAIDPVGMNRQALTDADIEARRLVLSWAAERGYGTAIDDIGNMFIRRPGRDESAMPIVTGSHIDSQPAGGPFDGAFGVLAACEVLEALEDAGIVTERPVEVAVWTNEEGSRFQPTTMGSAVFAGQLPLVEALSATDTHGISVGDALERLFRELPIPDGRELRAPFAAYLEAHIEQGPLLESAGIPIGVVTAIQGLRWFTVRVDGETGHAGTTPRSRRRDALVAAVTMVGRLSQLMDDPGDVVRFTVGRFEVEPNSPNTIPGSVLFTIDLRHPDANVLAALGDQVDGICQANAFGCRVSVVETMNAAPTVLDAGISQVIRAAATDVGLEHMDIASGATHDAKYVALTCPAGMIFIPCRGGVSHTVLEFASGEHMVAGTRVLAATTAELALG
jgi:N-carbamoyl-L-amino-acid hydrolase